MELLTAFLIGLAGSLHCIGMCGPIAVALPSVANSKAAFFLGRITYNLGRVLSYAILGIVGGTVGKTIFAGEYQRTLSIVLGILILIAVFLPGRFRSKLTGGSWQSRVIMRLKGLWNRHFARSTVGSMFIIGFLNGFLPCGLVYMALAGSIATGSPVKGAIFMSMFGFGTAPVMFSISLAGKIIGVKVKAKMRRLLPVGGVLLAMLFILRGMSLGIPYISPKFETTAGGEKKVSCCHHAEETTTPLDSTAVVIDSSASQ